MLSYDVEVMWDLNSSTQKKVKEKILKLKLIVSW
jgi:hypothetical protein